MFFTVTDLRFNWSWDIPSHPVANTLCSQCRGPGCSPGLGTRCLTPQQRQKIPCVTTDSAQPSQYINKSKYEKKKIQLAQVICSLMLTYLLSSQPLTNHLNFSFKPLKLSLVVKGRNNNIYLILNLRFIGLYSIQNI